VRDVRVPATLGGRRVAAEQERDPGGRPRLGGRVRVDRSRPVRDDRRLRHPSSSNAVARRTVPPSWRYDGERLVVGTEGDVERVDPPGGSPPSRPLGRRSRPPPPRSRSRSRPRRSRSRSRSRRRRRPSSPRRPSPGRSRRARRRARGRPRPRRPRGRGRGRSRRRRRAHGGGPCRRDDV
jgi:hypothetical protein